MQTALRLTARIQAGHKLEIVAPELAEGEEVTVVVTRTGSTALARHLLDMGAIAVIPPGRTGPPPRPIVVRGRPVSETILDERG
jgi:Fe2+ transport system protein FeoA